MGEHMRFTGGFRENGNAFAGLWELRSSDGSAWRPWIVKSYCREPDDVLEACLTT